MFVASNKVIARRIPFPLLITHDITLGSVCQLSTATEEFFSHSSRRAQRRRRKEAMRQRKLRRQAESRLYGDDFEDKRTIRDILFPVPDFGPGPPVYTFVWPNSFSTFVKAISLSWKEYKESWEGFFSNNTADDDDEEKENHGTKEEKGKQERSELHKNVLRNARFIRKGSQSIQKQIVETTGVTSVEDLKAFAADMMKLATECLKEFMAGYRTGRDEEVDKMLTQYFQDLQEQANKPRKRRKKRRVLVQQVIK